MARRSSWSCDQELSFPRPMEATHKMASIGTVASVEMFENVDRQRTTQTTFSGLYHKS